MTDIVVELIASSEVEVVSDGNEYTIVSGDIDSTSGGVQKFGVPEGRLTATQGVALPSADVSGGTSIYYTPAAGDQVPIFGGSAWAPYTFTELTLALDSNSGHTGYHQGGKVFDLFVINDNGVLRLATGPAWSSLTARGTGAGTTELEVKNGLWVNKNALTAARFGSASGNTVAVPAQCATFVGSFHCGGQAGGAALVFDEARQRLLSNAYNISPRRLYRGDPTAAWAYSISAYQQVNASTTNQVNVLSCLDGNLVALDILGIVNSNDATYRAVFVGIGIDSTTVDSATIADIAIVSNVLIWTNARASYRGNPGLGYHAMVMLERGNGVGGSVQGWLGAANKAGMTGSCFG